MQQSVCVYEEIDEEAKTTTRITAREYHLKDIHALTLVHVVADVYAACPCLPLVSHRRTILP